MKSPKSSGKPKKPSFFYVRRVTGDSMLPALRPGAIVLVRGRTDNLVPGDVVVIKHGGLEKVKRVQFINGNRLFVIGDNQEHSTDSRSFGWLYLSAVKGRVIWPRVGSMQKEASD
jgi:nickel-type superoxide dismutase maturation protease